MQGIVWVGGSLDLTEAGYAALRDGRVAQARDYLLQAVDVDSTDLRAWKGIVQASRELKDLPAALTAFNNIIAHTDERRDVIDAYLSKARMLDEIGNEDKARDHYERALQFDNTLPYAYLALAELSLRAGQWQTAIGHADHGLEQAAFDAPERAWMLVIRAIAHRKSSLSVGPVSSFFQMLGNDEEGDPGEAAFKQAVTSNPDLKRLMPPDPFHNPARTAEKIRQHMPKYQIPTYRL